MIFAKHDFTDNFFSAVGYKDETMENMIIIDEIARLIVDDKKSVVENLRKNGINVSFKDNPEIIKAFLVREIESGNDNVINFISTKIALTQLDETKFKEIAGKLNVIGTGIIDTSGIPKQKTDAGKIISAIVTNKDVQENAINLISSGVKKAFSSKNAAKTSNETQLSERLKANQMLQAQNKKKKYVGLKIIAILVGVGGIGYAIYHFSKKSKSNIADVTSGPINVPGYTPMNQ
jgi:hypothetical protein